MRENQDADVRAPLRSAAKYAHALYMDLLENGTALDIPPGLVQNRHLPLNDPAYFEQIHQLDAFCERFQILVDEQAAPFGKLPDTALPTREKPFRDSQPGR